LVRCSSRPYRAFPCPVSKFDAEHERDTEDDRRGPYPDDCKSGVNGCPNLARRRTGPFRQTPAFVSYVFGSSASATARCLAILKRWRRRSTPCLWLCRSSIVDQPLLTTGRNVSTRRSPVHSAKRRATSANSRKPFVPHRVIFAGWTRLLRPKTRASDYETYSSVSGEDRPQNRFLSIPVAQPFLAEIGGNSDPFLAAGAVTTLSWRARASKCCSVSQRVRRFGLWGALIVVEVAFRGALAGLLSMRDFLPRSSVLVTHRTSSHD